MKDEPDLPLRWGPWGAICCALPCLVLAMAVGAQWSARFALDDSLMFVRYADHVLAGEGLAWNQGEGSIYGPTSVVYVGVVALIRVLVGAPSLAVQLSSVLCGILFLAVAAWLAFEQGERRGGVAVVVALTGLAVWSESLSAHFMTGMDTTLAMLFLAVYLLLARGTLTDWNTKQAVLTAAVGGAALAVRPELCLFTVLIPLSVVVRGPVTLVAGWRKILLGTLGIFLIHSLVAWAFLGTPLPLSFYAKSINGYGAGFASEYSHVALAEFADFASGYWLLILPIGIDFCLFGGRWREREMAVERGVLVATILFLFYHLFMTLPIMPYKERFFHPVVPALVFLCSGSVSRLAGGLADASGAIRPRLPVVAALLVAALVSPAAVASGKAFRKALQSGEVGKFDLVRAYRTTSASERWFALDRFSGLPDDLVVAATEIGLLAALNPGKRIIDMTGLNDRGFATKGFSPDRLFRVDKPDLIYMPHPHYSEMIRALEEDGSLNVDYTVYEAGLIGTHFGVALRRSSRHDGRMHSIVRSAIQERVTDSGNEQ